jgi:hypothetical protein
MKMQKTNVQLLGYCGAYCKSCVFFTKRLSEESRLLQYLIECVNIDKWYKPYQFSWEDAKKFLKEMEEGKFNCNSCRVNPNWKECPVYSCIKDKRLEGCWECENFGCEKLEKVWAKHPEYLKEFIDVVKKFGIEAWVELLEKRYKEGKDFLGREVYR